MTVSGHSNDRMELIVGDLRAECDALATLLSERNKSDWNTRTRFYSWSVYDEIAHLALFDELAVLAAADASAFAAERDALERVLASGVEVSEFARRRYATHDGPKLAAFWQDRYRSLGARLKLLDAKDRLPWFGPSMSARSFVTARLMETWAHGQDIYDAFGLPRLPSPRLRHIAHLGVLTFAWSFQNRGMAVPAAMPYVCLEGTDGATWNWGEETATDWIRGSALDFCLVVTQRRHWRDTHLAARGSTAENWLVHAQCFAGSPVMGPPEGSFPR